MEQWDRDYIDLDGQGLISFEKDGLGTLRFGAVEVGLDYRTDPRAKERRIEFSFEGYNDADPCSGRGWAEIRDGGLFGRIFFHRGDESWFKAIRS